MISQEKKDFTPGPKLLPFGGFEVAALLNNLKNAKAEASSSEDCHYSAFAFHRANRISSGWLQSKIMAG